MDLLLSIFNENIWGEAKANIEIISRYFDYNESKNKIMRNLLDFIEKSDYTDVTPSKLRYELEKVEELTTEEIDRLIDRIKYYVKLQDMEILKDHASLLEENCAAQAMIDAKSEAGDSAVKLLDLLQKYEYKSTFSEEMNIINFKDLDAEKEMADSFSKFSDTDFEFIRRAYPSVEGWLSAQMIMVVGRPGGGKSLLMMQIAGELCKNGKRGIYVALGDLNPASFIIRMGAQMLHIPLTEAGRRSHACADEVKRVVEDRLLISCVAADKISVQKFMKRLKAIHDQFDFVVVDYDANFKSSKDSLYLEGGEIYSNLSELTLKYKKLCFVGCQPKNHYWNKEVLPMESGGESSRKQQFIDGEITIGCKKHKDITMGYVNFCKNRNGSDTVCVPYIRTSDGNLVQVSRKVYSIIKDSTAWDTISRNELQQIIDHEEVGEAVTGIAAVAGIPASSDAPLFFEDPENGE